jgi:hypothetical protein
MTSCSWMTLMIRMLPRHFGQVRGGKPQGTQLPPDRGQGMGADAVPLGPIIPQDRLKGVQRPEFRWILPDAHRQGGRLFPGRSQGLPEGLAPGR